MSPALAHPHNTEDLPCCRHGCLDLLDIAGLTRTDEHASILQAGRHKQCGDADARGNASRNTHAHLLSGTWMSAVSLSLASALAKNPFSTCAEDQHARQLHEEGLYTAARTHLRTDARNSSSSTIDAALQQSRTRSWRSNRRVAKPLQHFRPCRPPRLLLH